MRKKEKTMTFMPGIDANILAIIALTVLSSERIPKTKYNKEKKAIRSMVINIALFLSFDTVFRLFGSSDNETMLTSAFIAKSLFFLENAILVFLWNRYVGKIIWDEAFYHKWYRHIYNISITIITVIIYLNFHTPVLFRIGPGGKLIVNRFFMPAMTLLNYSNVTITYCSLIRNRRRLRHKNFILLALYPAAPILAEICQLLFKNIDMLSLYAIAAFLISKVDSLNDALRDPMTGLGNRLLLDDKLKRWFTSYRTEWICGIMLDIDSLKAINDTYGHLAGDEAIMFIAETIEEIAKRYNFYPIRYGGDEFMLIWKASSKEEAKDLIEKLRKDEKTFADKIPENRRVNYSLGSLICAPGDDMSAEDFLWLLDKRMYESKHETEKIIEYAIRNNTLYIEIQPIYSIPEGRLVSGEALLRLTDEKGNKVPPKTFIPIAESAGSIFQLEHYVIKEICALASIPDFEQRGIHRVGINVSATHAARESFPEYLINAADSFGIPHNRICVELTETAMSSNQEIYAKNIKILHDAGFKICMDDFGTGYSNLRRLSNLSLDMIKIDRQLIASSSPKSKELVRLAVNISHGLGYDVVAEGVETEEQAEFMRELNVEYIQGFYYERPLPPEKFLEKFPVSS